MPMDTDSGCGAQIALPADLLPATIVGRSGRFSVAAVIRGPGGEQTVRAHLPNSGRLEEALQPGNEARLRPMPGEKRVLPYTLALARTPAGTWISVDAGVPNRLVGVALAAGSFPEFAGMTPRPEVRYGASRIDYGFYDGGKLAALVEVKSCTLVDSDGIARFPDAPTQRGVRHLGELVHANDAGLRVGVVFMIQRSDARGFAPNDAVHAEFGAALRQAAAAGVAVLACACAVSPERVIITGRVPVML